MTKDELVAAVYDELSSRKRLVGKARVHRVIERTMKAWPAAVLYQCDEAQAQVVGKYLARSIERQERQEYGMGFFAAIILSALISEIIKRLLAHWLSNRAGMMEAIQ